MKAKTAVAVWLSVAGLCLAAAGTVRGASGTLPAPPAGWGDCDVLDYVAEGGGPAARGAASAGETVERWLVRDAAAGTRYALERRPAGGRDMSVCAYSPNRVLATLRPGSSHEAFAAELAARGMRIVRQLMEDLEGNPVYLIEAVDTEADVVDQMTMGIEETGACSMVKPDHIFSASVVPNDQNYGLQWGLEKIGAPQAWETRTDASSVPVAVLDTGINHDHFDLNMNLWLNEADPPGDGVDKDGNGIVDDTFGVSCLEGNLDGNAADDNGHGSHCAGIIGAEGNNRRLVAGVAWRAKIMALKFLNKGGRGSTSDAITCLRYAQEHGVRIVNCSFGSTDWDDYLYEQMVKMGRAGVVFVCAAGNAEPGMPPRNNDERPFYPANFHVDNLVSVAATDRDDNLANFSYYGKEAVDIAAPGVDIYSTVEGGSGSVGYKSGTSMAAPHVAGALALLMAEYPDETPDRIVDRLYAAAEPVEALEGKVRTGARLSLAGFFGIAPPADLSATQGTVQDAVVLYWQAAKEGTHYRVWRADSERGEKTMLCDWSRGLTFSDTGAAPGVTNWYFVQAARSADGDRASSFSAGVPGFRPSADTTHVTVEFDPAGGTVDRERVRYLIGEPYGEFPAASFAGMAFLGWFTAAEGGARMGETSLAGADTTRLHAHWIDENIPRIANLFARQRYPWNGLVDISLDLAGVPSGEFASVALSGTGADGGAEVPVRTFALGSFASLENGSHLAVWNAEADAPAGLCADLTLSATVAVDVPPAPASGTASNNPAASAIDLSWKAAKGASSYALSRGTSDKQSAAEPLATVQERTYRDAATVPGAEYHYWIRSVSSGGTSAKALHLSARRGLVPTALAISGPDAVDAGTTADYSCTATLSDGSALAVTPAWSITAGAAFADSIGTRGTLTAARTATPGNVTLRAEWSTNGVSVSATRDVSVRTVSVTVAFDAHGGTADPASHAYTAYGPYGTLSTATRTGYTFADWYTAASGGTEVAADTTVLPSVTTLHAHWTTNTYTVRFDANGGSGSMAAQAMTYDQAAALRANAFVRTGYRFAGWATTAGGAVAYADGASVKNLSSEQGAVVNLHAVWTPNTYTVRFNANGGSGTMADQTMTYDQAAALRANAFARTGYMFAGWATSAGGAVAYADGASVKNLASAQGTVVALYAVWTPITYTVRFNKNGGTGSMSDQAMTYDQSAALRANAFARTGYTFAGWATSAGGAVVHADGASVKNLESVAGSVVNLYAVWSPIAYSVHFNANGGTGTMADQEMVYGTSVALRPNAFARTGYTFAGWAVTPTGAVEFADESPVVDLTATDGAVVPLYAKWTPNAYTVRFNPNGGTGTMADLAMSYDQTRTLTPNAFVRTDYLFAGWATNATGSVVYEDCESVKNLSAAAGAVVNLYAKWGVAPVWSYSITNAHVTIKGVRAADGTTSSLPEILKVPEVLEGYPVTAIGWRAFETNSGLKKVILPEGLQSIGYYAFQRCTNLVSVTFPSTLTNLPDQVFSQCIRLQSAVFPAPTAKFGSRVFEYCYSLTNIVFPAGMTNLARQICYSCTALESVSLPSQLQEIEDYAFYGCSSLKTADFPGTLKRIGTYAFAPSDFASLNLPEGVSSIASMAFYGNVHLQSVDIPATVTNLAGSAFAACTNLDRVTIAAGNTSYKNGTDCVLSMDGKTLVTWYGKESSYTVPSGVQSLAAGAFECNRRLTNVVCPASVANYGGSVFYGCGQLAGVTLSPATTNIAYGAFLRCTNLVDVVFPVGEQTVHKAENAFQTNVVVTVPPREGYTFGGWMSSAGTMVANPFAQTNAITVTPVWETSGEGINGPDTVKAGGTASYTVRSAAGETLPATWSVLSGGAYASITPAGTFTAAGIATTQRVVIAAVATSGGTSWQTTKTVTILPFSVNTFFSGNGGTSALASKAYTAYGTYGTLPGATWTGHALAGWWTTAAGGSRVTVSDTVPAYGRTLYAHWTTNTYTLRFDPNGGRGSMPDVLKTFGVTNNLPANSFKRTGYKFAGWAYGTESAVVFQDGGSVGTLVSSDGVVITLYARWTTDPDSPVNQSRYDLRALGWMTPVKSRGMYATGWAFDALGSLESSLLGMTGQTWDFSENNLLNLSGYDYGFNGGGNAQVASGYLLRWSGPVLESQDAYPSIGTSGTLTPAIHVQTIKWIPGKASELANERIKQAVVEDGALYAQFIYSETNYNSHTHSYGYYGSVTGMLSNASIVSGLIAGWDDAYSKTNFAVQPTGDGAYIVRTSRGTDFGEAGYIHVSYYDSMLGKGTMWSFQGEAATNYARIYQHDPLGMVAWFAATNAANLFTAAQAEKIAAVGVWVPRTNATYTIEVYTGCAADNPASGTKAATKTVALPDAGYFTVPLDSPVPVAAGERFSAVVRMKVPGYGYPAAIEYTAGYSSAASAESGQSFYSTDGTTWKDLTTWNSTANFCCKVYTRGASSATVTVVFDAAGGSVSPSSRVFTVGSAYGSLPTPVREGCGFLGWFTAADGGTQVTAASVVSASVTRLYAHWEDETASISISGPSTVAAGGYADYAAVATLRDGTTTNVSATWKLTSDGTFGNISSSGRFTAAQTAVSGTETIQASFAIDGRTLTASKTVTVNRVTVRVTFDGNGGTSTTQNYVLYGKYGNLPVPTRGGYDFAGWWTDPVNGNSRVANDTVTTAGTNLYAHWTLIDWTIDANGTLTKVSLNGATVANIPANVTGIGQSAFSYPGPSLTSVTIPRGVTNIGNYAFTSCSGLTNMVIPSSVKTIGEFAFRNCSALLDVSIPSTVTNIGRYAFSGCKNLTAVSLPAGLSCLEDEVFSDCENLTVMSLPSSLSKIGNSAFLGCKRLLNVAIPETVTNIDSYAFAKCEALTAMSIPASVASLGSGVFYQCPNLASLSVNTANPRYCSSNGLVFNKEKTRLLGCVGTASSVTIPTSVLHIASDAFRGCPNLPTVTIPSSVTNIGASAFHNCTGLVRMTIPDSVQTLGSAAFAQCTNLTYVTLSSGLKSIGNSAFSDCSSLKNIVIPNSVTNLDVAAFQYCSSLTNAVLSSKVTIIHQSSFYCCPSLKTVSVSANLASVGTEAFAGCNSLKKFECPTTLTAIGSRAFMHCHDLGDISIPATTQIGSQTFYACSNMTSIMVNSANPHYASSGGMLYSKDKTSLLICPAGKTSATVLSSATNIAAYAFGGCGKLTSVSIPSGVRVIEALAFSGCSALGNIEIPATVTSLGVRAFEECRSLTNVTIKGALENYSISMLYSYTPISLKTYVTSKWTGPTDTWCGRPVVVVQ